MEYVSNFGREREAENMSLEAYKERLSDPPKPRRGLDGIPRTTCTASAVLVFPVWRIHGTRRVCRLRAVEGRTEQNFLARRRVRPPACTAVFRRFRGSARHGTRLLVLQSVRFRSSSLSAGVLSAASCRPAMAQTKEG
jgi:hypothetical protein